MKEEYNLKEISDSLKNVLKTSRFEHTLGVAYTAASLAMNYGYDTNKARVAGLLHDCAKYLSNDELVDYCKEHNLEITDGEIKAPHLLHAKAGAHMAKELYHIEDDEVLHAILVHTTGCPDMSLLDEIIFVADYIEPNRNKAHRLEEIRQMAFQNIKLAIAMILEDTISYIDAKEQFLDSSTIDTYDYYKKEISK